MYQNNDIVIASLLFTALAPGLILDVDLTRTRFSLKSLKKVVQVSTGKTSITSVLTHSLVYALILSQVRTFLGLSNVKLNNIIVPTVLSAVLSPGMLLTVEPSKMKLGLMSGKTSVESVLVHTAVFAILFSSLKRTFPEFY